MWQAQAETEGVTLLKADNKAGYYGVNLVNPGAPKPFAAKVWRGGTMVYLGSFATAEEAALCIARSPEGRAAAKRAAAAPPPTGEEVQQQAEAEGLTLRVADNKAGYYGVSHHPQACRTRPYQAAVKRGGKMVHLGCFATAEDAALCIARSPEGRAAAKRAAAAAPLTSEEARQQAEAEGTTLLLADNKTGYLGVSHNPQSSKSKPYQARVTRGGKKVSLGNFVAAGEAALCIARSPEGRAAAKRAAAAAPLTSKEARQQAEAEGLTLLVAENKSGYYGVKLDKLADQSKPNQARVTRGGKQVHLGMFVTAEEAALCVARSPEGRAAAKQLLGRQEHMLTAPGARSAEEQAAADAAADAEMELVEAMGAEEAWEADVVVLDAEEVVEEEVEEAEEVQMEVV